MFVHHAGKSGNQRGTSKREDILDTVIVLEQPEDYKPEQGARFLIKFVKARHFSGDDAASVSVQLIENSDRYHWEITQDPEEMKIYRIADLKSQGFTIERIIAETGLTKSQIETLTKKAKERGVLG